MDARSLADLFADRLRRIYDIESRQRDLLPSLIEGVSAPELRGTLEEHLRETRAQLGRLDEIFAALGASPARTACPTMEGLARECLDLLVSEQPAAVRDAAVIGACQCIEHHEIAEYGTARAHAQQLGFSQAADLLERTLEEESRADGRLSLVAEGSLFHSGINARAEAEGAAGAL